MLHISSHVLCDAHHTSLSLLACAQGWYLRYNSNLAVRTLYSQQPMLSKRQLYRLATDTALLRLQRP